MCLSGSVLAKEIGAKEKGAKGRSTEGKGAKKIAAAEKGGDADKPPTPPKGMAYISRGEIHVWCPDRPGRDCHGFGRGYRRVQAFFLDVYPVTVAEYQNCVDAGGCFPAFGSATECNVNKEDVDDYPINCIKPPMAWEFCHWAGKRLPTEDEWRRAYHGRDYRYFPWGNEPLASVENAGYDYPWLHSANNVVPYGSKIPARKDKDTKRREVILHAPVTAFPLDVSPDGGRGLGTGYADILGSGREGHVRDRQHDLDAMFRDAHFAAGGNPAHRLESAYGSAVPGVGFRRAAGVRCAKSIDDTTPTKDVSKKIPREKRKYRSRKSKYPTLPKTLKEQCTDACSALSVFDYDELIETDCAVCQKHNPELCNNLPIADGDEWCAGVYGKLVDCILARHGKASLEEEAKRKWPWFKPAKRMPVEYYQAFPLNEVAQKNQDRLLKFLMEEFRCRGEAREVKWF
jgi:hypothetical protein